MITGRPSLSLRIPLSKKLQPLTRAFVLCGRRLPDELEVGNAIGDVSSDMPEVKADLKTYCPTVDELYEEVLLEYQRLGVSPNIQEIGR